MIGSRIVNAPRSAAIRVERVQDDLGGTVAVVTAAIYRYSPRKRTANSPCRWRRLCQLFSLRPLVAQATN
jgi:hypothetical protein